MNASRGSEKNSCQCCCGLGLSGRGVIYWRSQARHFAVKVRKFDNELGPPEHELEMLLTHPAPGSPSTGPQEYQSISSNDIKLFKVTKQTVSTTDFLTHILFCNLLSSAVCNPCISYTTSIFM